MSPQEVDRFLAEEAPPVLDPFCGGGSIPLEAQRLGLRAFAGDLNPVAVLITKALIGQPLGPAPSVPISDLCPGFRVPWRASGAYRLYTICDRKGWAQEALAYNMLVVAWPRLLELASARRPAQDELFG